MTRKMRRQQGMTLLEVMVALMIFAIGCLALINSTGGQVRNLSEIEAKNRCAVGSGQPADAAAARSAAADAGLAFGHHGDGR
ncbi:prepilin-type N-terminal cleavage/methylation domain-containing protein [Serratia marcescens]